MFSFFIICFFFFIFKFNLLYILFVHFWLFYFVIISQKCFCCQKYLLITSSVHLSCCFLFVNIFFFFEHQLRIYVWAFLYFLLLFFFPFFDPNRYTMQKFKYENSKWSRGHPTIQSIWSHCQVHLCRRIQTIWQRHSNLPRWWNMEWGAAPMCYQRYLRWDAIPGGPFFSQNSLSIHLSLRSFSGLQKHDLFFFTFLRCLLSIFSMFFLACMLK